MQCERHSSQAHTHASTHTHANTRTHTHASTRTHTHTRQLLRLPVSLHQSLLFALTAKHIICSHSGFMQPACVLAYVRLSTASLPPSIVIRSTQTVCGASRIPWRQANLTRRSGEAIFGKTGRKRIRVAALEHARNDDWECFNSVEWGAWEERGGGIEMAQERL